LVRIGEYSKQRNDLTEFIQRLTGDSTIFVNKILWGNHDSQVHLYLHRRLNGSTFTEDVVVFVELDVRKRSYCNVYADAVIAAIKRNLTKEKIEEAFRRKPG